MNKIIYGSPTRSAVAVYAVLASAQQRAGELDWECGAFTRHAHDNHSQNVGGQTQRHQYGNRINELCELSEDEEVVINRQSIQELWHFIDGLRTPPQEDLFGLVTTHTGNLRASWESGESFFAAEFLGGGFSEWVRWAHVTAPTSDRCKVEELHRVFERAVSEAE